MEINVEAKNGRYVAEFTVTEDFNLHIERGTAGNMYVYQRGTDSGEYASLNDNGRYFSNAVVDVDITAFVYPKYIKVSSDTAISKCVVTYNQ